MASRYPIVPNNIIVHLGKPDDNARNITVSFTDYISNVASSEIYPTWPVEALKANIYAIISFAMNRIYNEWYRSKGYSFDITSYEKEINNGMKRESGEIKQENGTDIAPWNKHQEKYERIIIKDV